jgi:hypothetical protein
MTGPDVNTHDTRPAVTTRPLLGVAGVLLGILIATCTGRLMSVGLVDIRGALDLGVDEGSRINTAFNASMMFIGPFSVCMGGFLGRLFGGEMGPTFIGHFIAVREEFHSNKLGLNVQLGNSLTDSRLLGFQHAFAPHPTRLTPMGRAAEVLGLQVRQQAHTLAISDSFLLLATCCVGCLMVVSFMSRVPTPYGQVTAPVEAK